MAFTYVGNKFEGRDYVRMLIGDTDCDFPILQDYEIEGMLALYSNPVEAAAILCGALSARFAAEESISVDGFRFNAAAKAEQFRKRGQELFRQVNGTSQATLPIASAAAGGISKAGKEAMREPSDTVQPAFFSGQFDDPQQSDPD